MPWIRRRESTFWVASPTRKRGRAIGMEEMCGLMVEIEGEIEQDFIDRERGIEARDVGRLLQGPGRKGQISKGQEQEKWLRDILRDPRVVGVVEIGLDAKWGKRLGNMKQQEEVMGVQVEIRDFFFEIEK